MRIASESTSVVRVSRRPEKLLEDGIISVLITAASHYELTAVPV